MEAVFSFQGLAAGIKQMCVEFGLESDSAHGQTTTDGKNSLTFSMRQQFISADLEN